jgi:hypothetical protein
MKLKSRTTLGHDQILIGVQTGCFERTAGRPFVATRIERVTRLLD